jgi:hypothetical protein
VRNTALWKSWVDDRERRSRGGGKARVLEEYGKQQRTTYTTFRRQR